MSKKGDIAPRPKVTISVASANQALVGNELERLACRINRDVRMPGKLDVAGPA